MNHPCADRFRVNETLSFYSSLPGSALAEIHIVSLIIITD